MSDVVSGKAPEENPAGVVTITSDFVRAHSVLMTRGDLRPLFERWHRHQDKNRIALEASHSAEFEEALAAFALHMAGQSRNRLMTWTVNIGRPAVNFFLGGDTQTGAITGRVFTEGVAAFDDGQFFQESFVGGKGPFRSHATFEATGIFGAVEEYYAMSEQRPARLFDLGECRYAMAHAHPDYDEGWFTGLTTEMVRGLDATHDLGRIETRSFGWRCGCEDPSRIPGVLLPTYLRDGPEVFFGGADPLEIVCPRCAAKHDVTRARMAEFADGEARRKAGGK